MTFLYPLIDPFKRGYSHGQWTFYGVRHSGVDDSPIPSGSKYPARAPESGLITSADYAGACGNRIVLKGDSGFKHYMCHFSRRDVYAGQRVARGQHIGIIGTTGISTGVHLHRVLIDPQGREVNPDTYQWVHNDTQAPLDIPSLFLQIWKRPAASGEIAYFEKRIQNGTIVGNVKLKQVMGYWYGIVYPNGKYSPPRRCSLADREDKIFIVNEKPRKPIMQR